MSSSRSVGKIFYMNGQPSHVSITRDPKQGRVLPLNRTFWKSDSYRKEFYSHSAEFLVSIIRTCRKKNPNLTPEFDLITINFKYLSVAHCGQGIPQGRSSVFRTGWKTNSYPAEFLSPEIRTPRNSIRTGRKATFEMIDELANLVRPINTFLFISKGEESDDSLKH